MSSMRRSLTLAERLFNALYRAYVGYVLWRETEGAYSQREFRAWLDSGHEHAGLNPYEALTIFVALYRVFDAGMEPRYDYPASPVFGVPWGRKARLLLAWWVRQGADEFHRVVRQRQN